MLTVNNKYIKNRWLFVLCFLFVTIIVIALVIVVLVQSDSTPEESPEEQRERELIERLNIVLENDVWMNGGDNVTGWERDIVPNIVHYVLFREHKISFVHMLSLFSVIQIQKPEAIFIHCDCDRIVDDDVNFERVLNLINETNEVTLYIHQIEMPTKIYGKPLKFAEFHASDVTRYRTLMKYGGLYLDNDVFVCNR